MSLQVLYTAAHAEFPDTEPLGGGKAVADWLTREWNREKPFELSVLSPRSLELTLNKPLAQMSELQYARFCRRFERAITTQILKHDPRQCVVLSNDISEGPNFRLLGERGYQIVTIFHVDVVEFFTKFYLRGILRPEQLAQIRCFSLMPDVLRLVFQKQRDCVRHSARLVVPSAPMRETILRCYPWSEPGKIRVLPWGNVDSSPDQAEPIAPQVAEDEFVILTLSRLSPEKGIDWLLQALREVQPNHRKVRLFVCGAPAYMKGRAYERKLRRLAASLDGIRAEFPGHVTGSRKAGLLQRADLFVSPSRHESYGLTIAEAQAAGCRVISHSHYGASGQVVDCSDPRALRRAIEEMIASGRTQKPADRKTQVTGSNAARVLARLLMETSPTD